MLFNVHQALELIGSTEWGKVMEADTQENQGNGENPRRPQPYTKNCRQQCKAGNGSGRPAQERVHQ